MLIDLQPGKTLCGNRYTIMEKIGEGGFSFTYRAVQNDLNRIVCIKEYFPSVRCTRDVFTHQVMPQDKDAAVFEKYRQAFRKEAEYIFTQSEYDVDYPEDVQRTTSSGRITRRIEYYE